MSLMLLCAGKLLMRYAPAFLPTILTLRVVVSMSLRMSFVPVLVSIASVRNAHSSSESSKLIYTPDNPACSQLSAMFIITKLLPDPDPPANILSSPLLIPPYKILSMVGQPVDTCPPLL